MGAHGSGRRSARREQLTAATPKTPSDGVRGANPETVLYGRRRGPRLRPSRQRLLHTLLPRLSIALPEDARLTHPLSYFPANARTDLWIEIGFGGGEHLAAQAAEHGDVAIIGCEPFVNGIARLLATIDEAGIANIRLFPDDGRALIAALPACSVGRLFVLFPDPWPKSRHHKRRLITAPVLDQFSRVLKDDGELRFATDHRGYCQWTLARLLPHPDFRWLAHTAGGWRERPDDWPETRYERKARDAGRSSVYLRFRRRARIATQNLEARADSRI